MSEHALLSVPVIFRAAALATDFERSMERLATTLASIDIGAISRLIDQIDGYDEHHPKPLPIDGREYARRRSTR